MPRVTFTIGTPVVRVTIVGQEDPDYVGLHDDGGLLYRFQRFLRENDIEAVAGVGCAGGLYSAFFRPADAKRVEEWLRSHGVEDDPESSFM